MPLCRMDNCKAKIYAKGICSKHYQRVIYNGTTDRQSTKERFEQYVIPVPEAGCFIWIGGCNSFGYGIFNRGKRAHRVAWELYVGPIPKGMCIT